MVQVRKHLPVLLAAFVAIAAAAMVAQWWRGASAPEAARGEVVVVPASPTRPQPDRARPETKAQEAAPSGTRQRILAALQQPGGNFRDMRTAENGDAHCGEVSTVANPSYRRFVWLASTRMLAVDDGSAEFLDLFRLCDAPAQQPSDA